MSEKYLNYGYELIGIKKFIKSSKKTFIIWILLTILLALIMVSNAFLLKYLTESLTNNNFELYKIVVLITAIYMGVQGLVHYIRQVNSEIFSIKALNYFRFSIFQRFFKADIYSIRNNTPEKYISQFTSQLSVVKNSYLDTFTWGSYLLFQFIFATVIAFCINPLLAIFSIILCLPLAIIPIVSRKIISKKAVLLATSTDNLNEYIGDSLQSVVDWKMVLVSPFVKKELYKKLSIWEDKSISAIKVEQRIDAITSTFTNTLYFGVWIIGGFLVFQGNNSLGEIVAFAQLISNISVPLYSATSLVSEFYSGKTTLREIDSNTNFSINKDLKNIDKIHKISYNDYNHEPSGGLINLNLDTSKKYLVIGDSGSGKSSLFYPILKLKKPESGKIYINDIDVNCISSDAIFKNIGYVSQFSRILNTSILENVRMYDRNISAQSIKQALQNSGLEYLSNKDSIERKVTNYLNGLSGGEKQRLLISRLLVRKYQFCIFDEITTGLDKKNSLLIEEKIFREFEGFVYITHHYDFNFINKFDYVIKIKKQSGVILCTPDEYIEADL